MKGPRIFASRFGSLLVITLVLAALIGGALADAQSQPPDTDPHLLVVPATSAGEAALARTDARVIARYEAFSLVEARGADDERLRRAGADRRDDMRTVRTAAGAIDPKRERRSLAGKEAPERDEVLALVQFVGPPKDDWLARLRGTGARIVSYQAENGYVVHAGGDEVERMAALVGSFAPVRAVGVLTAADKLESQRGSTRAYAVQTVAGGEGADARAEATQAGVEVGRAVSLATLHTQYLRLSPDEAAELARDPAVVAIEPYAEPQLADERAAQIVAGNLSGLGPSAPNYLDWLVDPARIPDEATFDFAVDVTDEGLDNGLNPPAHSDFRVQAAGASRVAYLRNYSSDGDARDCGGHGTNVASIATGYNAATGAPGMEDGAGFNHGLGVAPFAKLGASKIFTCAGSFAGGWTPLTLAANAYADTARVSNNSWGTSGLASWGAYSSRAQQYDAVVRDAQSSVGGNQQLVEVFAAGNDGEDKPNTGPLPDPNEGYGTIMAEATAKNVITVGGAEGVRASGTDGCGVPDAGADSARDIIDFSARGPTDDGRLKPDLVAPGTHVTGARPQHGGFSGTGTCNPIFGGGLYSLVSGTSQAAPQVSGAAALLRHWYSRTQGADPSPALTKALLINTASDLAGGDNGKGATIAPGPNTDQGWGRANLGAAFDSTAREYRDQLGGDTFGGSGQSALRTYRALDPAKPVKVTLVWTDAPGPTTGGAWVNNLDLEVEAGGQRYLGNVFAGALSRSGGSADTRNNVESVFLPAGAADRFAVTVKALQIGGDGVPGNGDATDQDFALVVSNADDQPAPVLVHDSTSLADPGPGGDGDSVLESDEEVDLTEQVRNAGNVAATGLSATLSAGGGLNVTQPSSGYPNLAPGAVGSNAPAFEAELANAATCGADVPATLDITTTTPAAETHRIPLLLPTGHFGAPLNHDASGLPLPVPDDSAAGVSSSVFVADRGRIKDLNLRLPGSSGSPGLEHDFLGDVVIDLIGPDGTTVRLAEHPGGPDNFGKDFVNVTFDDEASLRLGAPDDPVTAQRPPYNGSFKPQNDQLSRFDGKSRRGTWTLRVRDLFEFDTGTLRAWGTTTQKAVCNFDTSAPDTGLTGTPDDPSADSSPAFGFTSPDAGATFECQLDSGAYEPCSSPKTYGFVVDGSHTFRVRAVDGSDNEDPSPAQYAWTVDAAPPDTTIDSGPAQGSFAGLTSAAFTFSSDSQATFECSLDGAAFAPCSGSQSHSYTGLTEGGHTFAVRAIDPAGKTDASPAIRSWTVDTTAPAPTLTTPAAGTDTADTTPTLAGSAGTAAGDDGVVTVKLFNGTLAAGLPGRTLIVPRNATGAWRTEPATLAKGTYTARVEQGDSALPVENIGVSRSVTFTVGGEGAASFAVAPTEERLSDALAGRYTVLAACAAACRVTAKLTLSARAARRLGLRPGAVAIGSGAKRLKRAGTAAVRVRLTRPARAALRARGSASASLGVTVVEGEEKLSLKRTVSLRRSAGLSRVVRRGLSLWAVSSKRTPLRASLTLSRAGARELGLKSGRGARVVIASGRTTASGAAKRLTLRVKPSAKKGLARARKARASLKLIAGAERNPQRTAARTLTLRR